MPVMDGYAATRELRSHPEWQHLPVIAMTASALVEDRERAFASGMNAHIAKPIHVESMLRTLAQWIAGPGAASLDDTPVSPADAGASETTALDTAAGLSFCMGNETLYRRLLEGFRDTEAGLVGALNGALAQQRREDALQRVHDMKGLAGTIGAHRLLAAVQVLHEALAAPGNALPTAEIERVGVELERVLDAIDAFAPRA